MNKWAWLKLVAQNRRTIYKLAKEAIRRKRAVEARREPLGQSPDPENAA
jgi:hypothetical protein